MNDSDSPRRWRIAMVGVLLSATALGSACNELPAAPIDIHNQSNQPITVVAITGPNAVVFREDIGPGDHGIGEGCVERDLEARLSDGRIVATRPGPFCEGDPVWVISQADVDAAS